VAQATDSTLALAQGQPKEPVADGIQALIGRIRHRVETVFSILTTVFNVERHAGAVWLDMSCGLPPVSCSYALLLHA